MKEIPAFVTWLRNTTRFYTPMKYTANSAIQEKPLYLGNFRTLAKEDKVVLIDSLSKRYNECGIRIGALINKHQESKKNIMKFCQARLSPIPLLGQTAEASIDTPR